MHVHTSYMLYGSDSTVTTTMNSVSEDELLVNNSMEPASNPSCLAKLNHKCCLKYLILWLNLMAPSLYRESLI